MPTKQVLKEALVVGELVALETSLMTIHFLDDNKQTGHYIVSSTNLPPLYTTARLSPLSLTYFSYCLEKGDYLVSLLFAEIQFTNDTANGNLGRRLFDIYIQVIIL